MDYWRFKPEAFPALLKDLQPPFVESAGAPSFPPAVVGIGVKGQLPPAKAAELKIKVSEWKQSWDENAAASSGLVKSDRWKAAIKSLTPPLVLDLYRRFRRTR